MWPKIDPPQNGGCVETGLDALNRFIGQGKSWVCERCGQTRTAQTGKAAPKKDDAPACKSKSGEHRWRSA